MQIRGLNVFPFFWLLSTYWGSMLYDHFFGDCFPTFRLKNGPFLEKPMLWSSWLHRRLQFESKSSIFFLQFFWRKYFQNLNIGPWTTNTVSPNVDSLKYLFLLISFQTLLIASCGQMAVTSLHGRLKLLEVQLFLFLVLNWWE
jgi:hypothetical protein